MKTAPTPAQVAARRDAVAALEAEGLDDFDLSSAAGLHAALRQVEIEGQRLTTLASDLRAALDEADDDAKG